MTLFSSQPGDEGLPGPARARVMAAIMTTTLMGVFDGTMINIALPSMAQEMQVPASIAVWFANGYLLAAAMTLAIFAALAARLGYRPVFLAGLTTFTLTSLGCALANKPEVLIGMRVLQGIGGAATLSIAPAILRSVFPGRLLGRILGFHALLIASSSAIGPVLGGTILHTLSWQWLFAINVLPGTLALLLAVRALPRDAIRMQAPFDTVGAILSALQGHETGEYARCDHGGEQPTERYFSIRQPLLDGSRCAERHGFYLANPPHGSSLTAAEHV